MAGASKKQWDMGLDVVRYLKGTKELGLTYRQYKGCKDMSVIAHTDSDFANDKLSGKSILWLCLCNHIEEQESPNHCYIYNNH
jgi:hypothetical protein